MAIRANVVTVGTSPTPLVTLQNSDGSDTLVRNTGSVAVYIGAGNVTPTTGFPINAGEALTIDLGEGTVPYGVVATGTSTIAVLQVGSASSTKMPNVRVS